MVLKPKTLKVSLCILKKFNLNTNEGLNNEDLIISRALRFLIEQDLYWVVAHDRWVLTKGKHVTHFFAPMFPKLPKSLEAWLISKLVPRNVEKQAYAQGDVLYSFHQNIVC